jgi:hypothetical protein
MARTPGQNGNHLQPDHADDFDDQAPDLVDLDPDEDENEDDEISPFFHTLREDPDGRWPAGGEPIQELAIHSLWPDESSTLLIREPRVEVEPGVLPEPRFDPDVEDYWSLNLRGRWNAPWSGNRLVALSLDCFSSEWPEVFRLVFDPEDPLDLLVAYNAAFPGLWGMRLFDGEMTARNARDEILGHQVSARDPRLAMQIAARYPGVAEHMAYLAKELYRPSELTTDDSRRMMVETFGGVGTSLRDEYAPGAEAVVGDGTHLQAFAAMHGGSSEPPMVPFIEPIASTLDTYTLIGAPALAELREADLLTVPHEVISALAANVTFADAITAIRHASPARLPLWIDCANELGEPLRYRRPGAPDQPLYGVMVFDHDDEDDRIPVRVVAPFGRTAGLIEKPLSLCALAIGPDDAWRYPVPENYISLLTAHRGGVAVRHKRSGRDLHGTDPPITDRELGREIAGYVAHTTEWILARVGAILRGLDDGLLLLEKMEHTGRSYRLIPAPANRHVQRAARNLDARVIVSRLRELGSLSRVAEIDGADIVAIREALARAGVDPDQVRRDEAIQRFRRSGSIESVVAELHIFRSDVERFLAEAGIDWTDTPVPHDVTDPDVLAAIAAYREEGTLDGAGARLNVSSETVRRRLQRAGLNTLDIVTDARRQAAKDAVNAWKAEGRSLAGAARRLGVDPRTVKDRLREAGIAATTSTSRAERAAEVRKLNDIVNSPRQVAALMGISASTVRRYLDEADPTRPAGRPRVTDDALDQAELALAEHGSIRAAARALGMSVGGFAHRLKVAQARHSATSRTADQTSTDAAAGAGNTKEQR